MKRKHHTVIIPQNELFENMLISYYYQILKIPIMFSLKILIDLWLIKQNIMVKNSFFDIIYSAFIAQKY